MSYGNDGIIVNLICVVDCFVLTFEWHEMFLLLTQVYWSHEFSAFLSPIYVESHEELTSLVLF